MARGGGAGAEGVSDVAKMSVGKWLGWLFILGGGIVALWVFSFRVPGDGWGWIIFLGLMFSAWGGYWIAYVDEVGGPVPVLDAIKIMVAIPFGMAVALVVVLFMTGVVIGVGCLSGGAEVVGLDNWC